MEFVNAVGVFILMAGIIFLIGYALRHRGSIAKWLNNLDHKGNEEEREDEIVQLRRRKEDIDRRLKTLEKED